MLKLRDVLEGDFTTPDNLRKVIMKQAGESFVSADLDFHWASSASQTSSGSTMS